MPAILTKKPDKAALESRRVFETLLTVSPDAQDLSGFLECLHVASVTSRKNPGLKCIMLTHESNSNLAERSGLFESVHTLKGSVERAIRKIPSDVVYVPKLSLKQELSLLFSGRVKITGGSRFARYLRSFSIRESSHLEKLKRGGLDLLPEAAGFVFPTTVTTSDRVFLNLFSEHNVSGAWPVGHAARLCRLLASVGYKTIIPLPSKKFDARFNGSLSSTGDNGKSLNNFTGEIQYLRKSCPDVILKDYKSVNELADLMLGSALVVSPAGPQTILATLLQRPVITLHDMQSFRVSGSGKYPKGQRTPDAGILPLFDKIADSLDRHLMPQVEVCIENCSACAHLSCVDTISPERVFENFKKIVLPF